MASTQPQPNYRQLQDKLDEVLAQLQTDDVDVDTALKLYDQGLKLVQQLEARLKLAENKVRLLKAKP